LSYFPVLTHLDLSNNFVINERAIRFNLTQLTYLNIRNTSFSIPQHIPPHVGTTCPYEIGRLTDLPQESALSIINEAELREKK
jgi:hypothetical protein